MANPYFVLGFAFLQGNDATFSNSCYLGHIPWWTGVCVGGGVTINCILCQRECVNV